MFPRPEKTPRLPVSCLTSHYPSCLFPALPSRALHPEPTSPSRNGVDRAAGVGSGHPVMGQESRSSVWVRLPARPSPAPGSLLYLLPRTRPCPGREQSFLQRGPPGSAASESRGRARCPLETVPGYLVTLTKRGAEQPEMRPVSCLKVGGEGVMHLHKETLRRDSRS